MTTEQILLTLCRRCRDAFATAIASLEEQERKQADADLPSLFDKILKAEPEPERVPETEETGTRPAEPRHRTPSPYRGLNAREGFISTTKISEQLTGKPHGANKEVIRICKDCGITLHRRSVNPESSSHLYVDRRFIPTIVHQYHATHA